MLAVVLVAGLAAAPAAAQPTLGGIELSRLVTRNLLRLQEDWLQWVGSFYQSDAERMESQVDDLASSLALLGMERLPDLSIGASIRAIEAARQGNEERAAASLAAAERLDAGRPETSFAAAVLADESGATVRSLLDEGEGYRRLLDTPHLREIWRANVTLASLTLLLVAGACFVVLQMATKGAGVVRTLHAAVERFTGGLAGFVVALVLLMWPILLPNGVVWLLLYWSVLLWGIGSVTERSVVIVVWIVAGLVPVALGSQARRLTVELSPPSYALHEVSSGRLYGAVFSDLGILLHVLPEHPAVHQALGDLHRKLGDWERARAEYLTILESEPENEAALIDLGAYYFRKSDYGSAIGYFQRAASSNVDSAAAYYNLSQAYSESLLFEDRERALGKARELSTDDVSSWLQAELRVVTMDGGLDRQDEIRDLLAEAWAPEVTSGSRYFWLGLPLVAVALAIAFSRISEGSETPDDGIDWGSVPGRALRVLVPGFSSVDDGAGFRAFAALLFFLGLVGLASGARLGYAVPIGVDPSTALPATLGLVGLAVFFVVRAVREVVSGGG